MDYGLISDDGLILRIIKTIDTVKASISMPSSAEDGVITVKTGLKGRSEVIVAGQA